MKWKRILQQHGYTVEQEGGDVDPFLFLAQQAKASGLPTAAIEYKTSLDYGKVSCVVTIQCPQDECSINLAGELAFRKSLELTNDGASQIGEPPLPSTE